MPDYAEVAGCSSTFQNSSSPTYDSFGAYASTTLVGRQYPNNSYSAPNSVHYTNFINSTMTNGKYQQQFALNGSSISMSNDTGPLKMNIIENKMEQMLNNLNNPTNAISQSSLSVNQRQQQQQQQQTIHHQMKSNGNGSKSVPQTPFLSSMRRNRHLINNSKLSSPFVDGAEQPLFMKSKFDESWSSIPSTTALTDSTTTSNNNSPSHLTSTSPFRSHHLQSSLNQLNNADYSAGMGNNGKAGSNLLIGSSYLSSFGKSDKV